jgi:hypothetical protein
MGAGDMSGRDRLCREEGIFGLKKTLGIAFALLFAMAIAAGVGASQTGWTPQSGYQLPDYWFTHINAIGDFVERTPPITQNSAQTVIYDADNELFVITAHPNYTPYQDDPTKAETTTVITGIRVYNPNDGVYMDPVVGGTFQIPLEYVRQTVSDRPYLEFDVTFTTYNNADGSVISEDNYPKAYFSLDTVLQNIRS